MNSNRKLIAIALLIAAIIGVSTYITATAARDAAKASERADEQIKVHRIENERRSSELADFISCALLIQPDERTSDELDVCTEKAGIDLPHDDA
jgi:hypothetical protein